jgi:hypothetical protein
LTGLLWTSKVNLPLSLLDNNGGAGLWLSVNRCVQNGDMWERGWCSIQYCYTAVYGATGRQVRASQRSIIPRYYTVSPGNRSPVTMVTAIYSPATRTHHCAGQVHLSVDLFPATRFLPSPLQLPRHHSTWSSLPISLSFSPPPQTSTNSAITPPPRQPPVHTMYIYTYKVLCFIF